MELIRIIFTNSLHFLIRFDLIVERVCAVLYIFMCDHFFFDTVVTSYDILYIPNIYGSQNK